MKFIKQLFCWHKFEKGRIFEELRKNNIFDVIRYIHLDLGEELCVKCGKVKVGR